MIKSKSKYYFGFTLVEVMISIMVMSIAYLGIMTLYMDVIKNHTQDQIVEQVRFGLSGQMDKIAFEIKAADSVKYEQAYQTTLIKIINRNPDTGEWNQDVEYRHDPDRGILVDGEQKNFYSNSMNHLFENDDIYKLEVIDFDLCNACPGSSNESQDVRENMYELTAEFELTSHKNKDFVKTLKFKNEFFALTQYSRTGVGEDDE